MSGWRWWVRAGLYALLWWSGVTPLWRWWNRRRAVILIYHGVKEADGGPPTEGGGAPVGVLQLPVRDFERHLDELTRRYRVLPLERLARGLAGEEPLPSWPAAITFDDGYRNVFTVALPRLERRGLTATVFLATGLIGAGRIHWPDRLERALAAVRGDALVVQWRGARESFPMDSPARRAETLSVLTDWMKAMDDAARANLLGVIERQELGGQPLPPDAGDAAVADWNEVRDALRRGLDFGSHTVNHSILTRCDLTRVTDELVESRRTLEKQLGRPIPTFSYPNGNNDAPVRARVRAAGYRYAVTVESGLNAVGADPYQLRRVDLGAADDRYTIRAKLAGLHDALRLALGRRRAAGVRLTLATDEVRS